MLKLPKRGGNGASQEEGGGGGEKEEKTIFFLPSPSPLFFFRPHTYRQGSSGLILLLSPIFLCHRIKDGGFIVAIRLTSFRPPKIRLHCRLESAVRIYYRYHKSEWALFFLYGQVHADPRLNLISTLETV